MKKIIAILILISMYSCEEIINEENITNGAINLLAPTESVILKTGTTIAFNWEVLNGATDYKLQIATPNFSNANQIINDTLLQKNNFSIDSLPINSYEWRVKALNSAYETVYAISGFVIEKQ